MMASWSSNEAGKACVLQHRPLHRGRQGVRENHIDPDAVGLRRFDRDMRYLAYSRRWLADYDLGEQYITGLSHYEIFPDLPERWKAVHQRCLAGAVEKAEEDPFPRADGSTDWVHWEAHPWRAEGGTVGGIILFSEVITVRKHAEDALRVANERLQALMRGATKPLRERIARCVPVIDRTLAQARGLALDLRPPQLDHLGLAATLRDALTRIAETADLETKLVADKSDIGLDKSLPQGRQHGHPGHGGARRARGRQAEDRHPPGTGCARSGELPACAARAAGALVKKRSGRFSDPRKMESE